MLAKFIAVVLLPLAYALPTVDIHNSVESIVVPKVTETITYGSLALTSTLPVSQAVLIQTSTVTFTNEWSHDATYTMIRPASVKSGTATLDVFIPSVLVMNLNRNTLGAPDWTNHANSVCYCQP